MRPGPLLLALLVSGCIRPVPRPTGPSPPTLSGPRTLLFLSDTHFGPGRHGNEWDPYEDFRWGDAFSSFLHWVDRDGQSRVDLVFDGDTFELWQSRDTPCHHADQDLGCSEDEALARLRRVLGAHASEMAAIGWFARQGDNRVYLVPGNHDAALLLDRVASAAVAAIGAPGRVFVAKNGYFFSPAQHVYAEHGHEIGTDGNDFRSWPRPFETNALGRFLYRPWGEQFVDQFYDAFEDKYPIIDNISDNGAAIGYAAATEHTAGLLRAAGKFIDFLLAGDSWEQFSQFAGGDGEGASNDWDLDRIKSLGDHFFDDVLADDDAVRAVVAEARRQGTLQRTWQALSSNDLRLLDLCDQKLAKWKFEQQLGRENEVRLCPTRNAGARIRNGMKSRQAIFRAYFTRMRQNLQPYLAGAPIDIIVWGHTHYAEAPQTADFGEWQPTLVNTGAWQRVVSPTWIEAHRGTRPKSAVLRDFKLEDLPACYSFVRIRNRTPELLFWGNGDHPLVRCPALCQRTQDCD